MLRRQERRRHRHTQALKWTTKPKKKKKKKKMKRNRVQKISSRIKNQSHCYLYIRLQRPAHHRRDCQRQRKEREQRRHGRRGPLIATGTQPRFAHIQQYTIPLWLKDCINSVGFGVSSSTHRCQFTQLIFKTIRVASATQQYHPWCRRQSHATRAPPHAVRRARRQTRRSLEAHSRDAPQEP
jgi:hypothetical protein